MYLCTCELERGARLGKEPEIAMIGESRHRELTVGKDRLQKKGPEAQMHPRSSEL